MKRLLALILALSVNAYGAAVVPNIFATQPSGNVPASYLDVDFALVSNYNTFSNYLVDSGAANAYVVTFPAGTTGSLAAGLLINFKAGADNTGASTLAANGMTAKSITNYDASALAAGQIKAGAIVSVIYDGTQFKLAGQPGGVSPSFLTPQATNTVLGNATSGSAAPTALAVGTCSTAASALIWTTNTGFGCNTSITANTAGTVTTAAQPNITSVGTSLAVGSSTAASGTIRLPNNSTISARNAANSADIAMWQIDTSNNVFTANPITQNTSTALALLFSGATTGSSYQKFTNTTGDVRFGVNASTGTGIFGTGQAYGGSIGTQSNTGLDIWTHGTRALIISNAQAVTIPVSLDVASLTSAGYKDNGGNLLISSTAPTIASGFGTSPACTVCNNTAAFKITIGSGGTASTGAITMPTAPNGWSCGAVDISNYGSMDTIAVGNSATNVLLANYQRSSITGAVPWNAGDLISVHCTAF